MTVAAYRAIGLAVLSALLPIAHAADEPPALAHNPFSRPPSEVIRSERGPIERGDDTGVALELQATMVGKVSELANVAGRILKPGDEIQGYVLVAVHEEYAVFKRDSRTITVYVRPNLAEDNE